MADDRDRDRLEQAFERNVRAFEHNSRVLEHLDRTLDRQARGFGELIAVLRGLTDAIEDQRDQLRANTEATWRMLDRFTNGGERTA